MSPPVIGKHREAGAQEGRDGRRNLGEGSAGLAAVLGELRLRARLSPFPTPLPPALCPLSADVFRGSLAEAARADKAEALRRGGSVGGGCG